MRDSQVGPVQLEHMDRYEVGWCGEVSDYRQPRPGEIRAVLPDPDKADECARNRLRQGSVPCSEKSPANVSGEILREMEASKLRGRGGAGFPAGTEMADLSLPNRKSRNTWSATPTSPSR